MLTPDYCSDQLPTLREKYPLSQIHNDSNIHFLKATCGQKRMTISNSEQLSHKCLSVDNTTSRCGL